MAEENTIELDDLWNIVSKSKTGHITVGKVLKWYKENVNSDARVCTSCNYEVKFLYSRVQEYLKENYGYGQKR